MLETAFIRRVQADLDPYWPGGAIALDGDGPPRLERLLGGVPADGVTVRRVAACRRCTWFVRFASPEGGDRVVERHR